MYFAGKFKGYFIVPGLIFYLVAILSHFSVRGGLVIPRQDTLVNQCCFVQSRVHSYNFEKLVTSRTQSTPGKGPVVQLYKNPIYHQAINKNICYSKQNNYDNPNCIQGVCEQQYINQEAMIHDASFESETDIGLGEIWVESGCKFVPFEGVEMNTVHETEEDESDVKRHGYRSSRPAWFVRFV